MHFARRLVAAVRGDALYDVAAGLTFYALLTLVPFLLLCVLLAGAVIDQRSSEAVVHIVARVAPKDASTVIEEMVRGAVHGLASSARELVIVAIGAAIWTASKATNALVRALNRAFHSTETRPHVYRRLLALVVTTGGGAIAAAAVILDVGLPIVLSHLDTHLPQALRWVRVFVSGGLTSLIWTALYRLLPARSPRLGMLSVGAVLGVAAWLLATWGLSLYIDHVKDFGAIYGAFGGIVVLLLWLWMSFLALLVGAAIDRLRAETARGHVGDTPGQAFAGHAGRPADVR
jgi:membrane protein